MAVLLWVIVIGFIAGVIARLVMPGPNTPKGFVVTTIIGVAGALLATVVGDLVGLYRPGQCAGLIGATIGALVILFIWNRLVAAQVIPDHGL
ncbi:MAG: GlsB/YeaQ/YmgE family stress response membrane protein [Pseudolabrys sp.]